MTLKNIIRNSIKYRINNSNLKIDREVRDIVSLINNLVRFKISNAIKCFYDIYTFSLSQIDKPIDDIPAIHAYLEIRACDKLTMTLISLGFFRQTAIETCELMQDIDVEDKNIFEQVKTHQNYNQLHRITRKEIESLRW